MKKLGLILVVAFACSSPEESKVIDIQGHRGARGLAPENSVEGFLMAAEMGVNTLELDLVVSKDGKLVVSHEPYFSPDFCLDTLGNTISEDSLINIYELDYADIRKFDCGSKGNSRFSEQKKISTPKPLLTDVLDTVEGFVLTSRPPIFYNIELKTTKETDSIYHPSPAVFSDLVYKSINENNILDKANIQSFDFRTLQYFNEKYPDVRLALLIENNLTWKENIDSLGFTPEIYSCDFELLTKEAVQEIQNAGMKVIPWTVNEISDLNKMFKWEVDGIITDYPDRALNLTR